MPAAFFVVRATVTDPAKRTAFDTWYSREHLPDACSTQKCRNNDKCSAARKRTQK